MQTLKLQFLKSRNQYFHPSPKFNPLIQKQHFQILFSVVYDLSLFISVRQASEKVVGADSGPVSERAGLPHSDGREQRCPGDPDPCQ